TVWNSVPDRYHDGDLHGGGWLRKLRQLFVHGHRPAVRRQADAHGHDVRRFHGRHGWRPDGYLLPRQVGQDQQHFAGRVLLLHPGDVECERHLRGEDRAVEEQCDVPVLPGEWRGPGDHMDDSVREVLDDCVWRR